MSRLPSVAIVGSGPSGCYVAQALQKKWPEARITIFEALPAPYGLVRYGIAADHQGSKSVIQQFERVLSKPGTRFVGNVYIGRDISYEKLSATYDIVVHAIGLSSDAKLAVKTSGQPPIQGAGKLLKYLNGHPQSKPLVDLAGRVRQLGDEVCLIGAGNVSIDVARLLLKSDKELAGSDISDHARKALGTDDVKKVTIVSRSSAAQAKCDMSMLEELLSLPQVSVSVQGVDGDDQSEIARAILDSSRRFGHVVEKTKSLHFVFDASPIQIDETNDGAALTLKHSKDAITVLSADTVITAIGFDNLGVDSELLPPTFQPEKGVYKVGWYNRGPKGTVAENRKDAKIVSDAIICDFQEGLLSAWKLGYEAIVDDLPVTAINYAGWKRIDSYELVTADTDRCRRKVTDKWLMLRLAHDADKKESTLALAPALIA